MIFTNLTFRALGRTHIASKPCVAIAMLCFDSTVGFPWSVPVLKQQLSVQPAPLPRGSVGDDASGRPGRGRAGRGIARRQATRPLPPRRRALEHGSPRAGTPSTPAFGPGPRSAPLLRGGGHGQAPDGAHSAHESRRTPRGPRPTGHTPFCDAAGIQTPTGAAPHAALRATPSPEVTELVCRLPLPTLSCLTRGCSPWRPAAVSGTALRKPAPRASLRASPALGVVFKGFRGGDGRADGRPR